MGEAAYLAVADGGGSGLRLRLHAPDGAVMATAAAGPASLTHSVEAARASIEAALAEARGKAGLAADAPLKLALALAGARGAGPRAALLADPPGGGPPLVMTDGYASLIGAHGGGPGAMVAVGTGVIAMARDAQGRVIEASGWGFPVGDEGGGAWIGRRAAQALTRALDGRGPASALTRAVAVELGETPEAVAAWLLEAGPTGFAALAPLARRAAEAGDAAAGALLDAAAGEVAVAVAALDRRARQSAGESAEVGASAGPVALLGGLAATLAPRLPAPLRARLVAPQGDALDGALMALTGAAPMESLP